MKVSIGSDHRGVEQRDTLTKIIEALGHVVDDKGSFGEGSVDYPDIAVEVAQAVSSGTSDRGILVCGTGIGMSMAANKVDGIRAALANDKSSAELSRQHNDANILCLAGNDYSEDNYREVVSAWLNTEFEGGRHARRVEKIASLESTSQ